MFLYFWFVFPQMHAWKRGFCSLSQGVLSHFCLVVKQLQSLANKFLLCCRAEVNKAQSLAH